MKNKKNSYFKGIDGLKSLAVVGVILYHINPNQFVGGYLGVLIFFVISGYFITNHLVKNIYQNTFSFKKFYQKRIKRIYPQLISVVSLTSTYILLFQKSLLHNLYQIIISNLLGVYNFWQIINGQSYFERFSQDESPFTHLWTLSIEVQYYLIWPIIVFILLYFFKKLKYVKSVTIVVIILSASLMALLYQPGMDTSRIYYGTDTRIFALMVGSLLALYSPKKAILKNVNSLNKIVLNSVGISSLILICVMSILPQMNPQSAFPYQGGMLLFTIITAILVKIILHPYSILDRLLTNRIFSYIGSRSYGIYLYQFPVMIFFENSFKNITVHHPKLSSIIEVGIILFISELSYQLIEKKVSNLTIDYCKNQFRNFKNLKFHLQVKWVLTILLFSGTVSAMSVSVFAKTDTNPNPLEQAVTDNIKNNTRRNNIISAQDGELFQKNLTSIYSDMYHLKEFNKQNELSSLSQDEVNSLKNLPVTAIGDSVMASGSSGLRSTFPKMIIDAAISRQVKDSLDILRDYKERKLLSSVVLIGLGTNGPFSPEDFKSIMNTIGSDRKVFWINVHVPNRPWQDEVNKSLAQFTNEYSNLKIIDWYDFSNKNTDWFIDDLTHLNALKDGPNYYGEFIAKNILSDLISAH